MERNTEHFILDMLDNHRFLTLATNRTDGWPQATTMGYVNEGMRIYMMTFAGSQKVLNIERDPRVSLAIDCTEPTHRRNGGISMAAMAELVSESEEATRIMELMRDRLPQLEALTGVDPLDMIFLRLTPKVVSVVDYEKGFTANEVVEV